MAKPRSCCYVFAKWRFGVGLIADIRASRRIPPVIIRRSLALRSRHAARRLRNPDAARIGRYGRSLLRERLRLARYVASARVDLRLRHPRDGVLNTKT